MDVSIVAVKATIRNVTVQNLQRVEGEVDEIIDSACNSLELPASGQGRMEVIK